jgi:Xaa-Pro aminopeptidase
METEVGEPLEFTVDPACRFYTGSEAGVSTRGVWKRQDVVISNQSPRVKGYWGHVCATIATQEPTEELARAHRAVQESLTIGNEAARPGVLASELDAVLREHLCRAGYSCPHHTGHGVGVTPFEAPVLAPCNRQPLEAGMVLALEPGAPLPGEGGVWLGHTVHITDSGAELLSSHSVEL